MAIYIYLRSTYIVKAHRPHMRDAMRAAPCPRPGRGPVPYRVRVPPVAVRGPSPVSPPDIDSRYYAILSDTLASKMRHVIPHMRHPNNNKPPSAARQRQRPLANGCVL